MSAIKNFNDGGFNIPLALKEVNGQIKETLSSYAKAMGHKSVYGKCPQLAYTGGALLILFSFEKKQQKLTIGVAHNVQGILTCQQVAIEIGHKLINGSLTQEYLDSLKPTKKTVGPSQWGGSLYIGIIDPNTPSMASIMVSNGNLILDSARDCDLYLQYHSLRRTIICGFTQLGDQSLPLKTQIITGTTNTLNGAIKTFAHGLTSRKIVSFTCYVCHTGSVKVTPNSSIPGHQYHIGEDGTNLVWELIANQCSDLINRPVTFMVWYTE